MTIATATATGTTVPEPAHLKIENTEIIHSFLIEASTDQNLSLSLRQTASSLSSLSSLSSIPYKPLRSLYFASSPSTRPDLIRLLSGSNFVFNSPKPREKSEELKARLRKLAEKAERREYEELVKDIKPRKEVAEPFSSYKDQIGFGLHVAVTMFSGYLVGYASFRALFNHNAAMNAAGGVLGLVCAMLVETLLFIIRTSNQNLKPSYYTSKLKKD
ncbi:ATPase, vacuolar ER assembly factor, Vma12 [Dillenia turbinata]|uniref:ATPase, vacuolar ER assembly factor, Vma12 n=1 Tax=Dillenia turbinata TaxID=194707 RepID=A0AAN8W0Q3_9MAGN